MKKLWLVALLVVAGCSRDGPYGLDAGEFVGEWVLHTEANSSCAGAAAAADRYFTVESSTTGESVNGDRTFNVVTEWDFVKPFRTFDFMVTGNYNLTQRTVELNFWHTVLQVGAEFTGTIDEDGTITGTLRDPKPGYRAHTVIGSCVFQATGRRL